MVHGGVYRKVKEKETNIKDYVKKIFTTDLKKRKAIKQRYNSAA
jgi:hypothetical protein